MKDFQGRLGFGNFKGFSKREGRFDKVGDGKGESMKDYQGRFGLGNFESSERGGLL